LGNPFTAFRFRADTIDRAKLTDRIGELPSDVLSLVEQAVLAALDIQR
jgi:mRNA-degrading endonuclease toxin of MazEF toxin-antitoxin module